MGQSVIRGRERLIEIAKPVAEEAIEDLVDVGLPLIDRSVFANGLGQRIRIVSRESHLFLSCEFYEI